MPMKLTMSAKDSYVTDQLLRRENDKTPDYLELKQTKHHLVFVYGTLRRGYGLHGVIKGAPYLGRAHSVTPGYRMSCSGAFPVVQKIKKIPNGDPISYIDGEIYAVDAKTILELDRVESNGTMYHREEAWFFLREQTYPTKSKMASPSVKAFIYLGDEEFWANRPLKKVPSQEIAGKKMLSWSDIPF